MQSLFELPEPVVAGAPPRDDHVALAGALPAHVRLGTMSWSFAGWRGLVYASDTPASLLSRRGLTGYAQHPLLRAVEIDRSYYEPLGAELLRAYAEQVPSDFRFLVYVEALVQGGAVHCHNAWGTMPSVLEQARLVPPGARNPLIIRWLLAPGEKYEDARDRFRPFDRITREDLGRRETIARLAARAAAHSVPVLVLINNKAEGCAPESAVRLAAAIHRVTTGL